MRAKIKKLFKVRIKQSTCEYVADLILRVFVGLTLAFAHGLGKIPPSEQFVSGVAALGFPIPELFGWMASGAEFLGGLFLALGLLTRPASFFVAFTMMVAAFGRHADDAFQKKELALVYLVIAIYFLLSGARKYSLDSILSRKIK